MDYKGYHIIVEINVNQQWDFTELPDGEIEILSFIDEGGADEDNIADFLVYKPDGDQLDWADDLAGAKKLVDDDIAKATN